MRMSQWRKHGVVLRAQHPSVPYSTHRVRFAEARHKLRRGVTFDAIAASFWERQQRSRNDGRRMSSQTLLVEIGSGLAGYEHVCVSRCQHFDQLKL